MAGSTDFPDADDTGITSHWALLIAGSAGWGNYRHQSDVAHAYQVGGKPLPSAAYICSSNILASPFFSPQVLRRGGYSAERIIVMVIVIGPPSFLNSVSYNTSLLFQWPGVR